MNSQKSLLTLALAGVVVSTSLSTAEAFFGPGLEDRKSQLWHLPSNGFLDGKIIEIQSEENWVIVNFKGEIWQIQISPETLMPPRKKLKVGNRIRIRGTLVDQETRVFAAEKVFPFKGRQRDHRPGLRKNFGKGSKGGLVAPLR